MTLLEIMLVMAIIGILATTVTLSMSGAGASQHVQNEAERIALAVELARVEALTRNEVWGLVVSESGYRFEILDPDSGDWIKVEERPFGEHNAEEGVRLRAATGTEGVDVPDVEPIIPTLRRGRPQEAKMPNIAILPDGEMTPFVVAVAARQAPTWTASSDGISPVLAQPHSDDGEGPSVVMR